MHHASEYASQRLRNHNNLATQVHSDNLGNNQTLLHMLSLTSASPHDHSNHASSHPSSFYPPYSTLPISLITPIKSLAFHSCTHHTHTLPQSQAEITPQMVIGHFTLPAKKHSNLMASWLGYCSVLAPSFFYIFGIRWKMRTCGWYYEGCVFSLGCCS